ncbi:MAG TPA: OmpH family outer membrane protein [Stellaceae bacterium]|nr:OmpH family outer membrane protein [Stellaceae bacterium]
MSMMLARRAAVAVALLAAGSIASAASAADAPAAPPAINVMVVDTARVLHESKAGKAIESQLRQRYTSYQQSISKQEADLASAQQELQKQKAILAQDAFAEKVKEFETRYGEARQKAQESQRELVQGENEAKGKVLVAMRQILEEMARERHANLVLDRTVVMIFDAHFEVTDDVIKRLDEKMPTLTVSFHAPEQAAPSPGKPAAKKPAPKKN